MNLGKIIFSLLTGDATVTGIIGSGDTARLYPDVIPQEIDRPSISYDVGSLPGVVGDAPVYFPSVTVSTFARLKEEAAALASAVDAVLNGATGNNAGTWLKSCYKSSYQELFDPEIDAFSVTLTYATVICLT